jgi:hypothetical protein
VAEGSINPTRLRKDIIMDSHILVQEITELGEEVILMDGSEWSINPGDSSKTCCWYSTQRVVVEKVDNGRFFNHVLINLDTATPDRALARRIK